MVSYVGPMAMPNEKRLTASEQTCEVSVRTPSRAHPVEHIQSCTSSRAHPVKHKLVVSRGRGSQNTVTATADDPLC